MLVRGGGVAAQVPPTTVYYPTTAALPTWDVAHDFLQDTATGRAGNSLLRILRNGRVAIGLGPSQYWDALSRFSIGKGMNSLTVDDLTANASINRAGVSGGATCLGFNAARQQDDGAFYLGSDGTNNGGALVWADTRGGAELLDHWQRFEHQRHR